MKNWAGHSVSTWSHLMTAKCLCSASRPRSFAVAPSRALCPAVCPHVCPAFHIKSPPSMSKRRPSGHVEKTISASSTKTCTASIIYFHIRTFYIHKINRIFRYKVWLLVRLFMNFGFFQLFAGVPKMAGRISGARKSWVMKHSWFAGSPPPPPTPSVATWGPTTSYSEGPTMQGSTPDSLYPDSTKVKNTTTSVCLISSCPDLMELLRSSAILTLHIEKIQRNYSLKNK